jgi:EAL domain-containing protein (putative c-di-GMP-specific phosphodiesterase class I)
LRRPTQGVETQALADFLGASGCEGPQGFLYALPRPLQDRLRQRCTETGVST